MNASEPEWEFGYRLTEEEMFELSDESIWTKVLSVATHPFPGGHHSDPYEGHNLYLSTDGKVVAFAPSIEGLADEDDSPMFWGTVESEGELVNTTVEFLQFEAYEIPAAIAFHFNKDNFAKWDSPFPETLPEFYWFRCERIENDFAKELDKQLLQSSDSYRYFVEFLKNPDDAKYAETKIELLDGLGFEKTWLRLQHI